MEAIHYLKARNSDFLSTIDLEIFEVEGKSNILKIKEVEYKENFMVNGRIKPRGVVITFEEKYAKPWIINPTNTTFVKNNTGVLDAKKWIGFSLELYKNDSVEMKISKTETKRGGISIKSVNTNGIVVAKKIDSSLPELTPESPKWLGAIDALKNLGYKIEQIEKSYILTKENKEKLLKLSE